MPDALPSRRLALLVMACVGLFMGADEIASERQRWQGKWTFASCVFEGQDVTGVLGGVEVTFSGSEVRLTTLVPASFVATVKLDPSKTPREVDFSLNQPIGGDVPRGAMLGIYEFDEQRLKVCLNVRGTGDTPRPEKFESAAESGACLLVFKRVK